MKKIKLLLLAIIVISSTAFAQYRNVALQAAGLTCSMCSNAINKALKPLPFISGIETDLKNNLFLIAIKPGMTPDFDLLKKKVEDAGFSVGKLTVEVDFGKLEITDDTHINIGGKNLHFVKVKPQTVNGWGRVQIIDKFFVTASQFKKMGQYSTMPCYKTGIAADCCQGTDIKKGERIYHVTM